MACARQGLRLGIPIVSWPFVKGNPGEIVCCNRNADLKRLRAGRTPSFARERLGGVPPQSILIFPEEIVMNRTSRHRSSRRQFLVAGSGLVLAAPALGAEAEKKQGEHPEVTALEDLMREHGLLERLLLVYEEETRRLGGKAEFLPEPLAQAAGMIRRFIEDYHEKLEEQYIFPRFGEAHVLAPLAKTLQAQHEAGRRLTDRILEAMKTGVGEDAAARKALVGNLRTYIRMYRPHAAREETALFPALYALVSEAEYHEMTETFEEREHALFGEEGFIGIEAQVDKMELALGIHDIAQYTPKGPKGKAKP